MQLHHHLLRVVSRGQYCGGPEAWQGKQIARSPPGVLHDATSNSFYDASGMVTNVLPWDHTRTNGFFSALLVLTD
jgi:hypothetical protein